MEKNTPPQARTVFTGAAGWNGTPPANTAPANIQAQTNTGGIMQPNPQKPAKSAPFKDPNLQPYLGTHVLKEDAYTESSFVLNSAMQLNVWLGYHQDITQHAYSPWLNSAIGTPRYYKTLYTSQYSPTHSACIRKIVSTTVGRGLEFQKDALKKGNNRIYANEVRKVLRKALYSLLVFGDSYTYQSADGMLDFWGLDILRINTEGGTKAVKAGIVKRTLNYQSLFGVPDFPTSIYPRTDIITGGKYNTVYRMLNENSTRTPWPEPDFLAAELPARNEYAAYAVGHTLFKNGVPPRFVVSVKGESVDSEELERIACFIRMQSSGLAANSAFAVVPDTSTGEGEGLSVTVLNNPEIPSFIEHKKELRETILALLGLTPFLAGFQTPGGLGSVNQRNAEYVNFIENTIQPLRFQLEESLILPYFEYCDAYLGTTLLENYIGFVQTNTLNLSESVDINTLITINEGRGFFNLPPNPDPDANIPRAILDIRKIQQDLAGGSPAPDNSADPAIMQPTNT